MSDVNAEASADMANVRRIIQDGLSNKRPAHQVADEAADVLSRTAQRLRAVRGQGPLFGEVGDTIVEISNLIMTMADEHGTMGSDRDEHGLSSAVSESEIPEGEDEGLV